MLYIVFKKGVQDDDRRKLLDHAKISLEEQNAIQNLSLLGVRLTSNPKKEEKKREKKAKKRADDVPFELSRYSPLLKGVMEVNLCLSSLIMSLLTVSLIIGADCRHLAHQ